MKQIYLTIVFLFASIVMLCGQNLTGTSIYINPGHGGYDSDDRNVVIAPYKQNEEAGFWESQSNLDKGFALKALLENAGATVYMSRTQNRTADDLDLSLIVQMANESQSDFMLSIHSNAGGGAANYVLQLYSGQDLNDTHVYTNPAPYSDESRAICNIIAVDQYSNKANTWSAAYTVMGDKTFGRTRMTNWPDGYGVLRRLAIPGTISEGSMHDYIPETYRLMNMDYKWLEAWHFLKSFSAYFNGGAIPTGNIVGTVHDSRNLNMATYPKLSGKDQLLPLHKATITVNPGNLTYTTDDLYNGIYVFKNLAPGTYEVKAEIDGYTSQTTSLEVKANEVTYYDFMLNMVRNTPPEVINHSPNVPTTEPVECSTPIMFEFNWDVDAESAINAFSIVPDVAGTITFEDSQHRMIFTPDKPYEKSTLYTVKLDKSLKHPADMHMVDDFTFQFFTKDRNRLTMFANYPKAGDQGVYYVNPTFEFRFDNRLNGLTIRDAIKIFNSQNQELGKNVRSVVTNRVSSPYGSNAFTLNPANLVPGETYRVTLSRGVIDEVGIDIVEPIEYTFKAVDVKVTDKPVVETFETAALFSYDAAKSSNVTTATFARNTSDKLFDTSSGKFAYTFSGASGGLAFYPVANPALKVNSGQVLGAHLLGDLTGNEIYFELKASDDLQYVKLTDLDFLGWEFAETALSSLTAGKDYTFTGIKIVQVEKPLTSSGSFSVDNLLLYDKLISSVDEQTLSGLHVYQSANKIQVISDQERIMSLKLYSIMGALLNRTSENEIDVASFPAGTYILKISTDNKQYTRPVVVVK